MSLPDIGGFSREKTINEGLICGGARDIFINQTAVQSVDDRIRHSNTIGFEHMGPIAGDYRNQFGERPSGTLKAGR